MLSDNQIVLIIKLFFLTVQDWIDDYELFKHETLKWQQKAEHNFMDISRQSHKDSLVLSGPDIPKAKRNQAENVTEVVCKLIKAKYNVSVEKSEVSNFN